MSACACPDHPVVCQHMHAGAGSRCWNTGTTQRSCMKAGELACRVQPASVCSAGLLCPAATCAPQCVDSAQPAQRAETCRWELVHDVHLAGVLGTPESALPLERLNSSLGPPKLMRSWHQRGTDGTVLQAPGESQVPGLRWLSKQSLLANCPVRGADYAFGGSCLISAAARCSSSRMSRICSPAGSRPAKVRSILAVCM